jgi:alpha-D-ribose 1-methylphosphonate 5-triphosphate synthase subunit PhnI
MPDARVIDQDVQRAVEAADEREKIIDRMRVANVTGLSDDLPAEPFEFPTGASQRLAVACRDDEVAANTGEFSRNRQANATAAARDKGKPS